MVGFMRHLVIELHRNSITECPEIPSNSQLAVIMDLITQIFPSLAERGTVKWTPAVLEAQLLQQTLPQNFLGLFDYFTIKTKVSVFVTSSLHILRYTYSIKLNYVETLCVQYEYI